MRIADFKLERYFARYEFTAPYLLCSSDAESIALDELLSMADDVGRQLWSGLRLGYTETAGHPALRGEIARLYEHIADDDVLVFSGAEEAIFAFMNGVLGPSDHVVALAPAYQSLIEAARASGADVTTLRLRHERGWALDLDELASLLRPATRVVVVNFPHNPTGMLPSHADFAALCALCESRGIILFCDEVYRYGEFDPSDRLPAACDRSVSAV